MEMKLIEKVFLVPVKYENNSDENPKSHEMNV